MFVRTSALGGELKKERWKQRRNLFFFLGGGARNFGQRAASRGSGFGVERRRKKIGLDCDAQFGVLAIQSEVSRERKKEERIILLASPGVFTLSSSLNSRTFEVREERKKERIINTIKIASFFPSNRFEFSF